MKKIYFGLATVALVFALATLLVYLTVRSASERDSAYAKRVGLAGKRACAAHGADLAQDASGSTAVPVNDGWRLNCVKPDGEMFPVSVFVPEK